MKIETETAITFFISLFILIIGYEFTDFYEYTNFVFGIRTFVLIRKLVTYLRSSFLFPLPTVFLTLPLTVLELVLVLCPRTGKRLACLVPR